MATRPIEAFARVIAPPQFPPAAAARVAGKLLSRHSAHEIAEAIEVLVDLLELLGGDPDREDSGDDELAGDEAGDPAWIEWQTRGRHKVQRFGGERLARDPCGNVVHEDDKDDDPAGQYDEDGCSARLLRSGAGCWIADPGGCEDDGREHEDAI